MKKIKEIRVIGYVTNDIKDPHLPVPDNYLSSEKNMPAKLIEEMKSNISIAYSYIEQVLPPEEFKVIVREEFLEFYNTIKNKKIEDKCIQLNCCQFRSTT